MQTDVIVAILTSSVVGSIVTKILSLVDERKRTKRINQMLLLNAIKQQAKDAIWDKYISSEDLECLEEMYAEYKKDKDSNGFADTLMNKVRVLPLREDRDEV